MENLHNQLSGKISLKLSFLLSFLTHILFFFVCFYQETPKKNEPVIVELTANNTVPTDEHILSSTKQASANHKNIGRKKLSNGKIGLLSKLLPQNSFTYKNIEGYQNKLAQSSQENNYDWILKNWKDSFSYSGDLAGTAQFSDRSYFFAEIYDRINSNLVADSLLSEYNHTGEVLLKFAVNADGTLVADSLSASALDPILKVRSAKALRLGLAKPFEENKWLKKYKTQWLAARFFWTPRKNCQGLNPVSGPLFTFCRNSFDARPDISVAGDAKYYAGAIASYGPFGLGEAIQERKKEKWRKNTNFDPFMQDRENPDYNL